MRYEERKQKVKFLFNDIKVLDNDIQKTNNDYLVTPKQFVRSVSNNKVLVLETDFIQLTSFNVKTWVMEPSNCGNYVNTYLDYYKNSYLDLVISEDYIPHMKIITFKKTDPDTSPARAYTVLSDYSVDFLDTDKYRLNWWTMIDNTANIVYPIYIKTVIQIYNPMGSSFNNTEEGKERYV